MDAIKLNDLAKRGPFGRSKLFDFVRSGALPARKFEGTTYVLTTDWHRFLTDAPLAVDVRREKATAHAA